MDITITSNLTQEGTEVTVDGKKIKNVHCIDFDMYHSPETAVPSDYPSTPSESHCFNVRITSKDVAEDGTEKHLVYKFYKVDDGEVKDSVEDITPKVDQLARFIADSMLGRKSHTL